MNGMKITLGEKTPRIWRTNRDTRRNLWDDMLYGDDTLKNTVLKEAVERFGLETVRDDLLSFCAMGDGRILGNIFAEVGGPSKLYKRISRHGLNKKTLHTLEEKIDDMMIACDGGGYKPKNLAESIRDCRTAGDIARIFSGVLFFDDIVDGFLRFHEEKITGEKPSAIRRIKKRLGRK